MAAAESQDDFSRRLTQTVMSGYVAPCIALGSQLGLFDKLAELEAPASSQVIADSLGMKERYVREWLKGMVHAQIVTYDPESQSYYLPRHRIEALKGMAPIMARGIPVLLQVHEHLAAAFMGDGPSGIPYDKYTGMHSWRQARGSDFDDAYIMHHFSQEPKIMQSLESGILVADLGCGTGERIISMAKRFPKSTFYGYDIDAEGIKKAKGKIKTSNCSFDTANLHSLPSEWTNKFGLVTVMDVIHDLPYPEKGLAEIKRVMKPSGCFFMTDMNMHSDPNKNKDLPHASLIHMASLYHCMPQSLFHEGGRGLGSAWGIESAMEMLKETGFVNIRVLGTKGKYADFIAEKESS